MDGKLGGKEAKGRNIGRRQEEGCGLPMLKWHMWPCEYVAK